MDSQDTVLFIIGELNMSPTEDSYRNSFAGTSTIYQVTADYVTVCAGR